ncbi:MAG: hypothetical protein WBE78_01725 [Candidatus Binataceae bacterium]
MGSIDDGGSGLGQQASAAPDDLRIGLLQIEHNLNEGHYRPGPWERYIRELKRRPITVRAALCADVNRVSRKLHLRTPRKTISVRAGVTIEIVAIVLGGVLLWASVRELSVVLALVGALLWVMTLQPLVKISAAAVFGVGYEYAYLLRGEPRFKMQFGGYVACPRSARVVLHLFGTIGSPLGAWAASRIIRGVLPGTAEVVMAAFWIVVAINVIEFAAGVAGFRRIGSIRTIESSGGAAGLEIYESIP